VKALRPRDGHHLPDTMIDELAPGFGPSDRGVFVLPDSGRLVGVAADGTVSVYDPETNAVSSISGPPPLPAGPAVGPAADAWYFAHRTVMRYVLEAD
jgi:DNA-binding beta-propeller fold protein YncE